MTRCTMRSCGTSMIDGECGFLSNNSSCAKPRTLTRERTISRSDERCCTDFGWGHCKETEGIHVKDLAPCQLYLLPSCPLDSMHHALVHTQKRI